MWCSELPPFLFHLFVLRTIRVAGVVPFSFHHEVIPCSAVADHSVYRAPIWQSAHIAVVYEHIHFQLAAEVLVVAGCLFRIVPVHGVKLNAPASAPFYRLFEQISLTHAP